MSNIQLKELFKKYLDETLTPEEFSQLYEMIHAGYDPEVLDELLDGVLSNPDFTVSSGDYDKKEVFASLLAKIEEREVKEVLPTPVIPIYRKRWIAVGAAAIIFLLAGSIYWMLAMRNPSNQLVAEKKQVKFDAPPGRSGAILTLSNGKQIELDNTQNGSLAQQGNTRLLKQGGKLSYKTEDAFADKPMVLYNVVTTPRGRQFQLVLADGTRVWLNAASSIKFPTTFNGKERRVAVSGEAYFEVAHNYNMPFVVQVNKSEIAVLGTHFDVLNYNDENNISATLLEGSIKVTNASQHILLVPGEQGKIERATGELSSKKVDADQVIAWTKGELAISNSDFSGLMRQISRWYDVDVVFQGNVPNVRIGGFLHRDVNLSTVLDFLGENGVRYKTEGKTITILQ
ncbi:FecR family protein [Chitinophaga niastensis]|uniref:FecR family protein n=1 Tax=Chitinophaga niastensis TaxID=536980 RepID=A0A2P8HGR4_CHINA|nr:FecR family protein [Chitinophaga niastensis]PSL45411.1 FecR family protein [Chitinophaga niastensis]